MSRRRDARTTGIRVTAAVAVVAIVAVTVVSFRGDDSGTQTAAAAGSSTSTSAVTTTTVDRASLDTDAQALLDLIDLGRAATFHARYSLSSADLGDGAASAEFEVWRDAVRIRQDTTVIDSTGVVRTAAFADGEGTVACRQLPAGEWSCQRVTTEPFDPENDLLGGVVDLLAGAEVDERASTVGPFEARCFTIRGSEAGELCLSPTGVPLRVDAGGVRYDVLEVEPDVTDADFVRPAEVTG